MHASRFLFDTTGLQKGLAFSNLQMNHLIEQKNHTLGVIQIIRDTRREGGVRWSVTHTFFAFQKLFLMLLEEKLFITKQDKASEHSFFLRHLIFKSDLSLKISHHKLKNVTQGVQKRSKKSVAYYLNSPLHSLINLKISVFITVSSTFFNVTPEIYLGVENPQFCLKKTLILSFSQ